MTGEDSNDPRQPVDPFGQPAAPQQNDPQQPIADPFGQPAAPQQAAQQAAQQAPPADPFAQQQAQQPQAQPQAQQPQAQQPLVQPAAADPFAQPAAQQAAAAPGVDVPADFDLSALDDEPKLDVSGTDSVLLKQINTRTSPMGRVVTIGSIIGVIALVYTWYHNDQAFQARMDGIEAAAQMTGAPQLAALRDAYQVAEHSDVKERILLNLGHKGDKSAVPLMISALDEPGVVRRAAARALWTLGAPAANEARPKLLEVLPTTDEMDRAQVVWALAVLKESAAVDEILGQFSMGRLQGLEGLDGKSAFDPKVIVDAVGPARLSSDDLVKHKDKSVRVLVASALAEAADSAAVRPLITLLEDEEAEVIRFAAAGLGRTGDPSAGAPLFALLKRRPEMRSGVLDSIARSTAAPDIARLIESANTVDLKRSLVSMLAETHDLRAADTLASMLSNEDEDTRQTSALALAELGDARAIPVLLERAGGAERDQALDAIEALEQLGRPEIVPGLLSLLEQHPGRRSAILGAIGASGDPDAGKRILAELEGDDVQSAAFALADLGYEPAFKRLLDMAKRPKDVDFSQPSVKLEEISSNRMNALRALGRFGNVEAIEALQTIIEDPMDMPKLRAAAGSSLGMVADAESLAGVIARVADPSVEEDTRTYYVQGLWQTTVQGVTDKLALLLDEKVPSGVRRAAALAIGYAADPSSDDMLAAALTKPALRRDAAFAILLGGSPDAAKKLYGAMLEDRDLREVVQDNLTSPNTDQFNLLNKQSFESGQVYRRLAVARMLKDAKGEMTFSYPWNGYITRLKQGWGGPGGLSPREVRASLWKGLQGDNQKHRELAAVALGAMNERGLLLRARDEDNPGSGVARNVLFEANRGKK